MKFNLKKLSVSKMKKNHSKSKKIFVPALCSALFILLSCQSSLEAKKIYEQPDYTVEDVRKEEIKRIDAIAETDLVQAYWRAYLLNDEKTLVKYSDLVFDSYKKALEEKDYLSARKFAFALEYLDSKKLPKLEKSSAELTKLCVEKLDSLDFSTATSVKVSELIKGTVTVWVDKGIKVEKGIGYADRVIGSGFFISKDGYLITNHHVIADLVDPKYEGYARLYVKLAEDSETRIPAKVIGWDSSVDLAVLKVEIDAPYVFKLGSSKGLEVGDKIYCIGSPIGLERTLTSGIVSASDRSLFSAGPVMQIDAAVNSGNSGGPCVDEEGNVQAIVFAGMLEYSGLNFAIPVEYLKAELPVLIAGGKYEHSWIEANGRTRKIGGKDLGVELSYVMPGGSASRAGLKEGDLITSIEDSKIFTLEDLQKKMMGITSGYIVKISYVRGEEAEKSVLVYLSSRPLNPGYSFYKNDVLSSSFAAIFGMKLNPLSEGRRKYQINYVIKGSIADESGFSEGDPIDVRNISFNQENTALYAEIYAKNRKKGYLDISMGLAAPLDSPNYF
ncbi:S1C family serine protease [Treponema pectinovorum]|uniref:S1C family serine protease n=1 Tax=Treponema pectinovorum TaxID=164 RepID=UPI0021C2C69C|nr:S1C family serine protease [Treponema pectinovorum]